MKEEEEGVLVMRSDGSYLRSKRGLPSLAEAMGYVGFVKLQCNIRLLLVDAGRQGAATGDLRQVLASWWINCCRRGRRRAPVGRDQGCQPGRAF